MRGHLYQLMIAVLAAGQVVVAGDGCRSPETDLAAPGSPLYEYAVKESIKTLSKQKSAQGAESIPPSPGPDYYWCKNCKAYHKRKTPASPAQPAAQKGTTPAQQKQPGATRPPSPGPDYYWCEKCKAYHRRQAQQPGTPHAHTTPPADSSGTVQGSGDYYYCENCKTYHRRQPLKQQPAAGVTNSPNPLIAP